MGFTKSAGAHASFLKTLHQLLLLQQWAHRVLKPLNQGLPCSVSGTL